MEGTQIRNFRKNKGLSLRAFGKQMGVSYERVRQLEAYEYISPEIQERICTAFNVNGADPLFSSLPTIRPTTDKKTKKAENERKASERAALKPMRAAYVREMRMNAGLTQRELAAALGVGQTQLSAWECGKRFISDETMERIESVLPHIQKQSHPQKKKRIGHRSRAAEPFITVCKSGLILNKNVMDKLGDSGLVQVYYLEKDKLLAIMAAKEGDEDTQKLYMKGACKLNNASVRKIAEMLMGFKVGDDCYRIRGTWKLDEEYEYWLFEMSKAIQLTQRMD